MAVAFAHRLLTVGLACARTFDQGAFVGAQAHSRAFVDYVLLVVHYVDYGVEGAFVELCAVCAVQPEDVSCVFYYGNLHAEAYAEIRNLIFAGIFCREYFAFYSPVAKSAGDKYSVGVGKVFFGAVALDVFGVYPQYFHGAVVPDARVREGFVNRLVCVLQVYVLSDNGDFHAAARRGNEPADY